MGHKVGRQRPKEQADDYCVVAVSEEIAAAPPWDGLVVPNFFLKYQLAARFCKVIEIIAAPVTVVIR